MAILHLVTDTPILVTDIIIHIMDTVGATQVTAGIFLFIAMDTAIPIIVMVAEILAIIQTTIIPITKAEEVRHILTQQALTDIPKVKLVLEE